MESISKRMRVEGNEDRISNLPESLIGNILSFLPTKDAVGTSVLSTNWKYLWTSITTLDFNDELVYVRKNNKRKQRLVEMSFINFVSRVLACNISNWQKFSLRCIRSYDASHVNEWVSTALSRNVGELHLSFITSLPPQLFTCTSLVVLKLDGIVVFNVPTLVCLQSLKILIIDSLEFSDDDSIYRLFSSCPVLEDLSIKDCDWRNISGVNISAPALKSLTISCPHFCHYLSWFDEYEDSYDSDDFNDSDCKYKFVLNTPNLQNLIYKDHVVEGYHVNKLDALVKADISVAPRDFPDDDRSMEILAIAEFVERISEVQWLHLSKDSIELCRFPLPKFDRLTHLELGVDGYVGWKLLMDFVESSPRLETLIFWGLSRDDRAGKQATPHWYQPHNVPYCMLFHLKKIEIKVFEGKSGELKMAEYFLKNSRFLEKLTIHPYRGGDLEIYKKILMLPRGSRTCQVEVF